MTDRSHDAARGISLPVTHVTVFEDRAAVERAGEIELRAGANAVIVRGVTPVSSEAHLTARVELVGADAGARVEDVRLERRWEREQAADGERLRALAAEVERAELACAGAERAIARAIERRDATTGLLERYLRQLARAVWSAEGRPAEWAGEIVRLEKAHVAAEQAVTEARAAHRAWSEDHQRLRGLVNDAERYVQRLVADVTVRLSSRDAGRARLVVSAVVPCAVWRPAHEAHLRPDGSVRWTTFATVWQVTGEPWKGVELRLSTDRPGAGADLPGLDEDWLSLQDRASRKQIVLAHRQEGVSADRGEAGVPGVYDGGEARLFAPDGPVDVPADGRPHRVSLGGFECPAEPGLTALPEVAARVFLRAGLRNTGAQPLLAGPVTLMRDGGFVGVGDVAYVGPGEPFELSFGSDDRFIVRHRQERREEERTLARDRLHFVRRAEITSTAAEPARVEVVFRLPVSEIKTLKVLPSEEWCSEGPPTPDADGLVRLPVTLAPGQRREVTIGFHFDAAGDLVVPDPW